MQERERDEEMKKLMAERLTAEAEEKRREEERYALWWFVFFPPRVFCCLLFLFVDVFCCLLLHFVCVVVFVAARVMYMTMMSCTCLLLHVPLCGVVCSLCPYNRPFDNTSTYTMTAVVSDSPQSSTQTQA